MQLPIGEVDDNELGLYFRHCFREVLSLVPTKSSTALWLMS
jgi:hypothetical protein